jgi:hypothetical protein
VQSTIGFHKNRRKRCLGEDVTGKVKQERIFYSWQADLPTKDHRNLIETALKNAIETINKEETSVHQLILDRDTKGVPGAPVIAQTIFGKVDQCTAFVADVTIVGRLTSGKAVINSNVSIELGYAFKAVPESGLILIVNKAYGEVEELPFDVKHRRVMTYKLPPEASPEDRRRAGKELQRDFELALRLLVDERRATEVTPVEELEEHLLDPSSGRKAARLIETEVEKLIEPLDAISTSELGKDFSPDGTYRLLQTYEKQCGDALPLYVRAAYDDDSSLTRAVVSWLKRISHISRIPNRGGNLHLYPALLFLYAGGIAAVAGNKYATVVSLIRDVKIKVSETQGNVPAAFQLVPYRVIDERTAKQLPPVRAHHFPMSDHLFSILREPLKRVIKLQSEYEEAFLRFEYLFGLASAFANEKYGLGGVCAPVGSYMWERNIRRPPHIYDVTDEELRKDKQAWPPFKAGIFDGTYDEFLELKRQADESIKKTTARYYL